MLWRGRNSVLVALGILAVTSTSTTTHAAPTEGILYSPKFSELCVDVSQENGSPEDEKVHQWDCPEPGKTKRNRLFRFEKVGPAYRIRPDANRRCLGIKHKNPNKGIDVVTQACVDEPHQLWRVTKPGGAIPTAAEESKSPEDRRDDKDYFEIRSMFTGFCMSITGNSKNKGAKIVQWPCKAVGNNDEQIWDIQGQLGYSSMVSYVPGLKGMWSDPISMPLVAVAAANLPDGNILCWASFTKSKFGGGNPGQTVVSIFDPDTTISSDMTIKNTGHDMFCPGTSVLFDGRIFITGGANEEKTTFYDPKTDTWSVGPQLNRPRGYQGQTVLTDGSVFLLGGSFTGQIGNKYGEVWDPVTNVWTGRTNIEADGDVVTDDRRGLYRADNHMWLYLAPNGKIFHAGPSKAMHWMDVSTPNGSVTPAGQRSSTDRMNGCSVMYDIGMILTFGGAVDYNNAPATTEAFIIDINQDPPVVTQTGSLHFPRVMGNAVVLPDGRVLAMGGQSHSITFQDDLAQYRTEMWDPATGQWELLENAFVPRNYHSTALLQKNAKVFSAGGGLCGDCKANHLDAEIFTPPYLLDTTTGMPKVQPMILEAPIDIQAGFVFTVKMDTTAVHTFSLCRLGAVTHSVDNDTRRIPLTVLSKSGQFATLQVHSNVHVALAGAYHLFAMNPDGVPSMGHVCYLQPPGSFPLPTAAPQAADPSPTKQPIASPTKQPIESPTKQPIESPTESPTEQPIEAPVSPPTKQPTTDGEDIPSGPGPFSPFSIYRLNAGGGSDDVDGEDWFPADPYVTSGTGGSCKSGNFGSSQTIGIPSQAQFLHQKELWGPCTFTLPIAPGRYRVIGHFVELHDNNQQVGARVFNFDVQNGQYTENDIDIFDRVGADTVMYIVADVTITNGLLIIKTIKGKSRNPKISALEVIPLDDASPVTPPVPEPTIAPVPLPTRAPTGGDPVEITEFDPNAVVNINAGGGSNDVNGKVWSSDNAYVSGGSCRSGRFGALTSGIPSDAQFLHQRERWGTCTFTIPNLSAGLYGVILHFAELHTNNQQVGARIFDVEVGTEQFVFARWDDVDIYAEVGANNPYYLKAEVSLQVGQSIVVKLIKGANRNPKISAIEVIPIPDTPVVTSSPIANPTSAPQKPAGPTFTENPTFAPVPDTSKYPMFIGSGPIVSNFGVTKRCLDQDGRSGANGNVHQWECHFRSNQQFELWRQESGQYTIILQHSGMCLSVRDGSLGLTTSVIQQPCIPGAAHQLWTIGGSGDARDLRVGHTGYCLALAGSNAVKEKNGANAIQFPCDDPLTPQMKWKVAALDP